MSGKQRVLEALKSTPAGLVGHAGVAAAAGVSKSNAAVCLHRLGDRVTYVDAYADPEDVDWQDVTDALTLAQEALGER